MREVLTIVVPTADRRELVRTTLNNVVRELRGCGQRIPLIVVDNASAPPVEQVALEYPYVEWVRNNERGDVGDSIIGAALQAKTEYVWVFGDDDLMCPGAIQVALTCLREHTPEVVYFNRYVADSSMNIIEGTEHRVDVLDYQLMTGSEAAAKFTHHPGFISSIIFKKDLIYGAEEQEKKYPGYGFMAAIYKNAIDGIFLYVTKPMLIQRRSVSLWKIRWPKFWLVTLPTMFQWLDVKCGALGAYDALRAETNAVAFRTLLAARANGYTREDPFWRESQPHLDWKGALGAFVIRHVFTIPLAKAFYLSGNRLKNVLRRLRIRK